MSLGDTICHIGEWMPVQGHNRDMLVLVISGKGRWRIGGRRGKAPLCSNESSWGVAPPGFSLEGLSLICLLTRRSALPKAPGSPMILETGTCSALCAGEGYKLPLPSLVRSSNDASGAVECSNAFTLAALLFDIGCLLKFHIHSLCMLYCRKKSASNCFKSTDNMPPALVGS